MKIGTLFISALLITNFCLGQKAKLKDDLCEINQNINNGFTHSFLSFDTTLVSSIDQHISRTSAICISKNQIAKLIEIQGLIRKVDFMMRQYQEIRAHCDSNIINGIKKEPLHDSNIISIPGKRQLRLLKAEYQLQEELFWYEQGNCEYRLYTLKIALVNELLKLRSMVIHHKYYRKNSLRQNVCQ